MGHVIFKVFLCPSYSSAVAVASCTMRARSTLFSLYRSMLSAVTGWAKRRSFMEEGSEGNGWRGRKEDRWSLVDTPLCQGRESAGVREGGEGARDSWSERGGESSPVTCAPFAPSPRSHRRGCPAQKQPLSAALSPPLARLLPLSGRRRCLPSGLSSARLCSLFFCPKDRLREEREGELGGMDGRWGEGSGSDEVYRSASLARRSATAALRSSSSLSILAPLVSRARTPPSFSSAVAWLVCRARAFVKSSSRLETALGLARSFEATPFSPAQCRCSYFLQPNAEALFPQG